MRDLASLTAEERVAFFSEFVGLLAHNMDATYEAVKANYGELAVEHATNGALGMLMFGLVLAERHPDVAEALKLADVERGGSGEISTVEAVEAVIEHIK